MANSLPPSPNLQHIKAEAKSLLKALQKGEPRALETIRLLSRYSRLSENEIIASKPVLREMQHALALDYGFKTWKELKEAVEGERETGGMLHVHCNDSAAGSLRASGTPGTIIVWHDPLLEGPNPAGLSYQEWLRIRAENLFTQGVVPTVEAGIQSLQSEDEQLEQFSSFDETVLWFDACLFDQLILIRQLDWFSQRKLGKTKLSLICVGEFPGFEHFHGLGELMPEKIASLMPQRHEVTMAEKELAVRAWAAYRSPDPRAIEQVLNSDTSAHPHLGPALKRHLQRFPGTRTGLTRMQTEILELVSQGEMKFGPLFAALSNREHPAFFGDNYVAACLNSLAIVPVPLIQIHGSENGSPQPDKLGKLRIQILPAASRVLAGQEDFVQLNGIDTWLGGVHLQGHESAYRWDEEAGKIVKM